MIAAYRAVAGRLAQRRPTLRPSDGVAPHRAATRRRLTRTRTRTQTRTRTRTRTGPDRTGPDPHPAKSSAAAGFVRTA